MFILYRFTQRYIVNNIIFGMKISFKVLFNKPKMDFGLVQSENQVHSLHNNAESKPSLLQQRAIHLLFLFLFYSIALLFIIFITRNFIYLRELHLEIDSF